MRRFSMRHLGRVLICCTWCLWPVQTIAQEEEDRGFVAGLIEDALGGEGREVRVEGFRGALSSTAQVDRITIADSDGIWLTLSEITMRWTRSALLQGEIDIQELSAARIDLPRLPLAGSGGSSGAPTPEVQPFALPELPVSVRIEKLAADEIALGAPVLGQAARLRLSTAISLAGGQGDVTLSMQRIDAQRGNIDLSASFRNETGRLELDLRAEEDPGGLVVSALGVPGAPDARLTLKGAGTQEDFTADLSLATARRENLGGTVRLRPQGTGDTRFSAELEGDLRPLMIEEYHAFFGRSASLSTDGVVQADGALALTGLDLQTRSLDVKGSALIAPDGWPKRFALTGRIADRTGARVRLPVPGDPVTIAAAMLDLRFDAGSSDSWEGSITVETPQAQGLRADRLTLTGLGAIAQSTGRVLADFDYRAVGFDPGDPALAEALGADFGGSALIVAEPGAPLTLPGFSFVARETRIEGRAQIDTLATGFDTDFDLRLEAGRLSRFAALTGLDLTGAGQLHLKGRADLGGGFDLTVTGATRDLGIGNATLDPLIRGTGELDTRVIRDGSGVLIDRLRLATPELGLTGQGRYATNGSDLQFDARLRDVARLVPGHRGPATATGRAWQDNGPGWQVDLSGTGPYGLAASARADLRNTPRAVFEARLPDARPLGSPFAGALALSGTAEAQGDGWRVQANGSGPLGVTAEVDAQISDTTRLSYRARLPNLADAGVPFSGAADLSGEISQSGETWRTLTTLDGPGGMGARLSGGLAPRLDLQTTGSVPLGLLNPLIAPRDIQGNAQFDIALRDGGLAGISGTLALGDAVLVAPTLQATLRNLRGQAVLTGGVAQIALSSDVRGGGRLEVAGPITLTGNLPADLLVRLRDVKVEDPLLYETDLEGKIRVAGPLTGGAQITGSLDLGRTEISIPSTFLSPLGEIPDLRHLGETRPVLRTREKAGLIQSGEGGSASTAAPFGLDVRLNAPARIFVRGRGLDAELGGTLRIEGSTQNVVTSGAAELVRGRLDILGKRFTLDEGQVLLLGSLDPAIRFVASTTTDSGTASIIVSGRASSPEVTFTSSPELPQDEVLAQLLFGKDLSQISALQALELASAVATLAGRGGKGVVGELRDRFKLDDLDLSSDDAGNTELRVGKYIGENVYTDVTVGQDARPEVSINIDLTPNITARGVLESDGATSLGVYFEKDY